MYPSVTIAAMTAAQNSPARGQLARGSTRYATRFAIARIGAISIALGILLIFELAFGRGNLLAG
jgi:hypothetical protein